MNCNPQPDRTKAPAVSPFGHLSITQERVEQLPNGIRLHLILSGTQPVNRIVILWHQGKDSRPYTYAASILPKLMLEGTSSMTGIEIADKIDFEGAWLNPRNDDYFTGLELISLNKATLRLLPLLSEIILEPTLPSEAFDALKQKDIAKLKLNLTRTRFLAARELKRLMSGKNHPYQNLTDEKFIELLKLQDLRDSLAKGIGESSIDFYVGGQPDETVIEGIRQFAAGLRKDNITETDNEYIPYQPEPPQNVEIKVRGARQASIAIGIPTINRAHPDYIPLRMSVVALGGYFGSRLMTNIREEKGLTYGISASLLGIMSDAYITIAADCDPSYIEQVITAVKDEISLLATEPMGNEELARLKMYLGTVLASTLDSPFAVTDNYMLNLTLGTPTDYFERQQEALASLDASTVMEMTRRYILNPTIQPSTVIARP